MIDGIERGQARTRRRGRRAWPVSARCARGAGERDVQGARRSCRRPIGSPSSSTRRGRAAAPGDELRAGLERGVDGRLGRQAVGDGGAGRRSHADARTAGTPGARRHRRQHPLERLDRRAPAPHRRATTPGARARAPAVDSPITRPGRAGGCAIDGSSEPSPASRSTTRTTSSPGRPGLAGGGQQVSQGQVVDRHGGGGRAAQRPLSRCADPPGPGAARRRASRGGRGLGGERGDGADGPGGRTRAGTARRPRAPRLRALGARLTAAALLPGRLPHVDPLALLGERAAIAGLRPPRLDELRRGVAAAPGAGTAGSR